MDGVKGVESQVIMDTEREIYTEENLHHVTHYKDQNDSNYDNESNFSSFVNSNNENYSPVSPKRDNSMDEFTIDTETDIENNSFTGALKRIDFEGKVVIMENKNIFQNNKLKLQMFAAMISLFLIGLSDQVIGSLMEFILNEYDIDRVQISYLFFAQFCGYIPASMFNNYLMGKYGLHKLYYTSCLCVIIPSFFFFIKAPYVVLPLCSICFGWSNGTFDCVLNYFVGTLDYSNELLGIMHSMYGFGCLVTPVLSISLIQKGMLWNYYYLFLIGTAFFNLVMAYAFFQNETATKYRYLTYENQLNNNLEDESSFSNDGIMQSTIDNFAQKTEPSMMETVCNKYVVFYSLALFAYVGSELSVGVWLNNYLFRIRNITQEKASYITSSYWLFMTLGRFFMGFFTGRYYKDKEIHAQVVYCFLVSLGCLGFWIFESSITMQVICICLAGWFVGPLFGTTIIIAIKTLPKKFSLHGISLIAGFGGTGAAIIPSIMGYVSEHFGGGEGVADGAGLKYFPNVVFISFTSAACLWLGFYLLYKNVFDSKIRLS